MAAGLYLSFLLSLAGGSLLASAGYKAAIPMRKFTIDLDKPPDERWVEILAAYKSSVPVIVEYFDHQAPKMVRELLETLMADLDSFLGELGQEMRAVADYWQIDLGIIVALNFAYELRRLGGGHPNTTNVTGMHLPPGMACTSIVAQDMHGSVYHGRNLDWNLPDNIRNLTVQADFLKNGEVIFTGDVTAGFVGIITGMSKRGFSISINERNLGGNLVVNALEALLRHAWSPTHLARHVLTKATSYNEAIQLLQKEPLSAPVYYITAGSQPNEGAVLTRDRNFLTDLWMLNVSSSVPNSWYLLETNYDHWKAVNPYDDRRFYGNMYMKSIGQEHAASMTGLYAVLRTWPVRNNYTTYTAVMHPGSFTMHSYDVYV